MMKNMRTFLILVAGILIQAANVYASITWSTYGSGINGSVLAVAGNSSELYVGGSFTNAGGTAVSNIAKWNGSSWSALGSGVNGLVYSIVVSGSDVYVGGAFTEAGGAPASKVAHWDGSSWSAMGSGMEQTVLTMVMSGSDVIAGGSFFTADGDLVQHIAKWNGSSWSGMGSGINSTVRCLAVSGGDVYAGGSFTTAGGNSAVRVAKWNGSSWSALGDGLDDDVYGIEVSGSDVYACGSFLNSGSTAISRAAHWDGSSWNAMGSGLTNDPQCIAIINSNVYFGGFITSAGGSSVNNFAMWNGSSWSSPDNGVNSTVYSVCIDSDNSTIIMGGDFTTVGGSSTSAARVASFLDSDNSLPVELCGFSGEYTAPAITLHWETCSEIENRGFILRRIVNGDPSSEILLSSYAEDAGLTGRGTVSKASEYVYRDTKIKPGITYTYELSDVDFSGTETLQGSVTVQAGTDGSVAEIGFFPCPAYPNPFNADITVPFTLMETGHVVISLVNVQGKIIYTDLDRLLPAGEYHHRMRAEDLESGIYIIQVSLGTQVHSQKVILLK